MLQILCSSVRVKLLVRAKLRFLREQPDHYFFLWGAQVYVVIRKVKMLNFHMEMTDG